MKSANVGGEKKSSVVLHGKGVNAFSDANSRVTENKSGVANGKWEGTSRIVPGMVILQKDLGEKKYSSR